MGKNDKPKVKAQQVAAPASYVSPYSGVQEYSVNLDGLSSGSSKRSGDTLLTSSALSPGLRESFNTANLGLNSGLGYLARSPQERMTDIAEGRNDFYNLAQELARKDYDNLVSTANQSFIRRGFEDSTTRGGFLAQLANDQLQRDLTNRIAALDYLDQKANTDVATNNATLAQLANFQLLPAQMANTNLQTGFASVDQQNQFNAQQAQQQAIFNAQQRQQADQINAQLAQQAAAQRSSMIGNLVGAGLSLAAIPFTGGLSGLGALGGLSKLAAPVSGALKAAVNPSYLASTGTISNMTSNLFNRAPLTGVGRAF